MHVSTQYETNSLCVFLGGPIQFAIDSTSRFCPRLRQLIQTLILDLESAGVRVLSAHRYERFGEVDMRGKYREVCLRDYKWMGECDVFAAVLPIGTDGVPLCSSGTAVELGWASAMCKPVVLVRDLVAEYSHLVTGLDAVTNVVSVDINSKSLGLDLYRAARHLWHPVAGQSIGFSPATKLNLGGRNFHS